MSTPNTTNTELSIEEMEALLKKKKEQQRKKREAEKLAYEANRDKAVQQLLNKAKQLNTELEAFKKQCHVVMDEQAIKLAEYGAMRSNSKGGFKIDSACGTMRVARRRDTEPSWDERSQKAIELIKGFLFDTVKKRDQKLYEILMSFLERNKNGDLEYSRVMDLIKHEDKFDDDRWKEGLKLIRESFSNHLRGYGYEFKTKDASGKWNNIGLTFSSL